MNNHFTRILIFISTTLAACSPGKRYDLAIANVNVFDAESKKVITGQTILINADTIAGIISANESFTAKQTIEGKGRLVTPAFIDTHTHLGNVLGDYEKAPEYLDPDSVPVYKKRIAETYLPFGVTVIKDCGQPEKWLDESIRWQLHPSPDFPDFYPCGSAIISDEERVPYMSHVEVINPEDAQRKVQEYYNKGLRYIKLYSRLRLPEFRAATEKARALGMNVCAHVEYNVPIDSALNFGVKHFEHLLSMHSSVLRTNEDWNDFMTGFEKRFQTHSFIPPTLEAFRYISGHPLLKARMDGLIDQMAAEKATLSTTVHVLASYVHRSYFRTYIETRLHTEEIPDTLSAEQDKRLSDDFDLLMQLLKQAHNKGVKITIGTDCKDGGKAALSEMMLLHEAGFSTEDILQIATWNGASAMDLGNTYGSIKQGKKANLVIFDQSPFENYRNFLAHKTVIKDGTVYAAESGK